MKYCTSTKWHHLVGVPDKAGFVEFTQGCYLMLMRNISSCDELMATMGH